MIGAFSVYRFAESYLKQKAVKYAITQILLSVIKLLNALVLTLFILSLIKPKLFDIVQLILGLMFVVTISTLFFPEFVSNVIGWVFIKYYKPFKQGDLIKIDTVLGIIEDSSIQFITLIENDTKQVVKVFNSLFLKDEFANFSRQKIYFVDFTLVINEIVDVIELRKTLVSELNILQVPKPNMNGIINFNNELSTINVKCYLKGDSTSHSRDSISNEVYSKIKKMFKVKFLVINFSDT